MAENEVLDVGNPRHFKRWREALRTPDCNPDAVAEALYQDFSEILPNKLRGKPLYLVLKACESDPEVLRNVVANLKCRELAKVVEQAHKITGSTDALIIAKKTAELLIDGLLGRAFRFLSRKDENVSHDRCAALERAASARLIACKPEITSLLISALRGESIRRSQRSSKARPMAGDVLSTSLLAQPR